MILVARTFSPECAEKLTEILNKKFPLYEFERRNGTEILRKEIPIDQYGNRIGYFIDGYLTALGH